MDNLEHRKASTLRICMLTTFYPPYSFGGDAMGVQRLAEALIRRGFEVTVVHEIDAYLMKAKAEPTEAPPSEGVKVIGLRSSLGVLSCLLTHQFGAPVVHGSRLRQLLKPDAFDIIWFNNVSLVGGPGLLTYGDGLKVYEAHEHWLVCPTHVLWRHGRELCDERQCLRCSINYRVPPQIWRYTNQLDRNLKHIDAFIAKSEFSRDKHREFGFPREMEVVPYFLPDNAAETERFEPAPNNRPFFLFVGRLEKIKGLDDVIPLFADYKDADLLVIGDGDYRAELSRIGEGIDNVKFLGRMAPDELSRYYHSAIALIVPSVCYETFGIILIESFRKGTPVIARRIGPFVEIVERCEGGILFSSERELIDAMKRMQQSVESRDKMAESARMGFEKNWSEEAVLCRYFETLHRAALDRGKARVAKVLETEMTK